MKIKGEKENKEQIAAAFEFGSRKYFRGFFT